MINKILLAILLATSLFLKAQEKPFVIKKFDSKAKILSNPVVSNNQVYFGNDDGVFFALDALTLEKRWSFKAASIIRSKPVVHGNTIYFKSGYDVYAVHRETGEKIWSYSKQALKEASQQDYWDYHSGVPVIHKSNIYFGFEDGTICGFDLNSGALKAELHADHAASVKSGLLTEEDMLYFGDWNGKLYAYDLNKNERLWKYDSYEKQEYPTFGQINAELTIDKGLLFFGARNPEFQAVDIKSAQKKWSYTEKEGGWISGDPLIYKDTLFIAGSDNHKLIAFDPDSGDKFWEYEYLFNNFSKPVIYQDFILFTTGDGYSVYGESTGFGYLYALNRKDGSIVNFSLIGGNLFSTPAIINENLFLCSEDGYLYKIDIHTFLEASEKLSEKGYRAFDHFKVDSESDPKAVKIDYKVNYQTEIKMRITDLSGNEIKKLHDGRHEAGAHSLVWDKMDNNAQQAGPGYYFVELWAGDYLIKTFCKID